MYLKELKKVNTFIFDIDGVFTDGRVFINNDGDLLRTMNIRDGYATKKASAAGMRILVITGGTSPGVEKRMLKLGASKVFSGIQDKSSVLDQLVESGEVKLETCAYMGDDMPDVDVVQRVAFGACPSDAIPEVLEVADYVSPKKGGDGCVRDVLEKWLKLHEKWGA